MMAPAGLLVVMGVSGCGKSSVARALAEHLQASFIEADDLHPPENVEKMRRGVALDDADRFPWLRLIVNQARRELQEQPHCVVSCSALKRRYRDCLREAHEHTHFVYLDGSRSLIHSRLTQRSDHFMPASLLDSQFDALEVPDDTEPDTVTVSIEGNLAAVIERARDALARSSERPES